MMSSRPRNRWPTAPSSNRPFVRCLVELPLNVEFLLVSAAASAQPCKDRFFVSIIVRSLSGVDLIPIGVAIRLRVRKNLLSVLLIPWSLVW